MKDINSLYKYIMEAEINKIGLYKPCEEYQIETLANELMIPVIYITDMVENIFYTDILPIGIANINNTASYVGIKELSTNKSLLIAQIYQKVMLTPKKGKIIKKIFRDS